MTTSLSDEVILAAIWDGPGTFEATTTRIARRLGRIWNQQIHKRLRKLEAEGKVYHTMKRNEFVWWKKGEGPAS